MEYFIDVQGPYRVIGIKTIGDNGESHRRSLQSGSMIGGKFVETDLSLESEEISAFAREQWTPDVIEAWSARLAELAAL